MSRFRYYKYAAATAGFTPAASATDIALIGGATGKVVRVYGLKLFGVATSAGNVALDVIRRAVANTGGTAVAASAAGVDPLDPASSAVVRHYTANPTISGTGPVTLWGGRVLVPAAASVVDPTVLNLDFLKLFGEPLPLRSAAQQLAINLGGATPTGAATFRAWFSWDEWAT